MRRAIRFGLVAGLASATAIVTATLALAGPSLDPPGFNGFIKIHEPPHEDPGEVRNEPQVCTFHIHGYKFDSSSSGSWRIESWPPTGNGSIVASSAWTASQSGEWETQEMTLPNGHYKAYADQTMPAAPGGEKQKVFWVRCPAAAAPPGQGSPPPGQGSPPPGQGSPPPGQGSPPPGQGSPPPGQGSPPPGQATPPPGGVGGVGSVTSPSPASQAQAPVVGVLPSTGTALDLSALGLALSFIAFFALALLAARRTA